jgi:hypothetical protein
MLRYTHVGNVNQYVKVAILSLIVKVTEKGVYPGNVNLYNCYRCVHYCVTPEFINTK